MKQLVCNPIGYIHSPFRDVRDTPKNGKVYPEKEAVLELLEEYKEGMADMKVPGALCGQKSIGPDERYGCTSGNKRSKFVTLI